MVCFEQIKKIVGIKFISEKIMNGVPLHYQYANRGLGDLQHVVDFMKNGRHVEGMKIHYKPEV